MLVSRHLVEVERCCRSMPNEMSSAHMRWQWGLDDGIVLGLMFSDGR